MPGAFVVPSFVLTKRTPLRPHCTLLDSAQGQAPLAPINVNTAPAAGADAGRKRAREGHAGGSGGGAAVACADLSVPLEAQRPAMSARCIARLLQALADDGLVADGVSSRRGDDGS